MKITSSCLTLLAFAAASLFGAVDEIKKSASPGSILKKGARLAIVGDSITEQKQYSKFIETYLLACPILRCSLSSLAGAARLHRDLRIAWRTISFRGSPTW